MLNKTKDRLDPLWESTSPHELGKSLSIPRVRISPIIEQKIQVLDIQRRNEVDFGAKKVAGVGVGSGVWWIKERKVCSLFVAMEVPKKTCNIQ